MKYTKQILVALFCIFFTANASAMGVTENNAAKVAKNYFSEVIASSGTNRAAVISETFDIKKDGNTVFYVFNFEKGGYVIVSAEDRFTPVLGYSPDGYYDRNNMPEGFEFLMTEFSEMIAFIQDNDIAATPEYTEKWEQYASENAMKGITIADEVAPMTALWNQDFPYNYYAPAVPGGQGGRAYAGCVATAMSMIMHYWKWPWQGTGKKSYRPSACFGTVFPVLEANFEETFYDYNGMYGAPDESADNYLYEPIALLQYHAGVAVSMAYCSDGSGAQSGVVPNALKNYFKYDQSVHQVPRGTGDNTAWTAMMKEQMDLGQPVYVSGNEPGAASGHAFVCDGYDTNNMFHYNFGWDGNGNGYFVSDKPDVYTANVTAIIDFVPDRSKGYPASSSGNWTLPYLKGTMTDGSGPLDNYAKGITATWLLDPSSTGNVVESFTIECNEIDLASGDYLRIYDGENESAPLLGEFTGSSAFETTKSTGGKVLIKFISAAGSATGKGFTLTYEATPKKHCDGDITLTAASGTFTDGSPEDMNYANSSSCRWLVYPEGAVDPETEITFKFLRLDTEENNDQIVFWDAKDIKIIESISGRVENLSELPQVTIKTREVMIVFNPNSYINGKGFEIEYFTTPVNIKDIENINDISVYPNPASDKLKIKFNTTTADDFDIIIYNITGQAVYKETLNNFVGSYYDEISINDFAQGVYLMQIKSSQGAVTQKVVIQ